MSLSTVVVDERAASPPDEVVYFDCRWRLADDAEAAEARLVDTKPDPEAGVGGTNPSDGTLSAPASVRRFPPVVSTPTLMA